MTTEGPVVVAASLKIIDDGLLTRGFLATSQAHPLNELSMVSSAKATGHHRLVCTPCCGQAQLNSAARPLSRSAESAVDVSARRATVARCPNRHSALESATHSAYTSASRAMSACAHHIHAFSPTFLCADFLSLVLRAFVRNYYVLRAAGLGPGWLEIENRKT